VCSARVPGREEEEEEEEVLLPSCSADPEHCLLPWDAGPGWMEAPGSLCTDHFLQDHPGGGPDSQEKRRLRETPWAVVTGRVPAASGRSLGVEVKGVSVSWGEGPSILLQGSSPPSVWLIFWLGFNTFNETLKVLRDRINTGQA